MTNVTKGKIGESIAIAILLSYGFEVYKSTVDIYGTDLIVVPPNMDNRLRIQIKSIPSMNKSFRIQKEPKREVDYYFLVVTNFENPRKNEIQYWLIPTNEIKKSIKTTPQSNKIKDYMVPIHYNKWNEFRMDNQIEKLTTDIKFSFHSLRTGKIGENLALAFLLNNDWEVYEVIADDKAVDLAAKNVKSRNTLRIQVKYSSTSYSYRNLKKKVNVDDYYFLFISGSPQKGNTLEFYLISSSELKPTKSGSLTIDVELRKKYKIGSMNF